MTSRSPEIQNLRYGRKLCVVPNAERFHAHGSATGGTTLLHLWAFMIVLTVVQAGESGTRLPSNFGATAGSGSQQKLLDALVQALFPSSFGCGIAATLRQALQLQDLILNIIAIPEPVCQLLSLQLIRCGCGGGTIG